MASWFGDDLIPATTKAEYLIGHFLDEQLIGSKKIKLELNAGQYVVHKENKWDILIGKIKIRGFTFPAQKKLHVF